MADDNDFQTVIVEPYYQDLRNFGSPEDSLGPTTISQTVASLSLTANPGHHARDHQRARPRPLHGARGEQRVLNRFRCQLSSRIGGQHRQPLRVHYLQPHRDLALLQVGHDREEGEREVGGEQKRRVRAGVVDGVEVRLHLDGHLRVGVDVLTEDHQRKGVGRWELLEREQAAVLHHRRGGHEHAVPAGRDGQVYRVPEPAERLPDGAAPDDGAPFQQLFQAGWPGVQDQVLHALLAGRLDHVRQRAKVVRADHQGRAQLLGHGAHLLRFEASAPCNRGRGLYEGAAADSTAAFELRRTSGSSDSRPPF